MTRTSVLVFAAILLAPALIHAQTISADRPGATDSATTVPRATLQVETGFEARRQGSVQSVYHLLTVARIGLHDYAELRVTPPGTITLNGAVAGTDPELGVKLGGAVSDSFDAGLVLSSSLPAVNPGTGSVIQARATGSSQLGPVGLSVTLGGSYGRVTIEDNDADFEGLAAVSAGFGVVGDLGAYVEVYSTFPQNGDVSPVADGGLTYLVAPWLQLDAYAGAGLYGDAPDWLAGMGLAVLIPTSATDTATDEDASDGDSEPDDSE